MSALSAFELQSETSSRRPVPHALSELQPVYPLGMRDFLIKPHIASQATKY
jgi:hypothetical protein